MNFTIKNIVAQYPQLDIKLPKELNRDEFKFIKENIDLYSADNDIKKYIDTFVLKLNKVLAEKDSTSSIAPKRSKKKAASSKVKKVTATAPKSHPEANQVEHFSIEEKFLKRYLLMDGKVKTKSQVLTFIKSLQKAITEKQIRKTSKYARQIMSIQENLIKLYHLDTEEEFTVKLQAKRVEELKKLIGVKKVRLSVTYIKRFIGLYGKETKEKVELLLSLIKKAIDSGKITKSDPYCKFRRC